VFGLNVAKVQSILLYDPSVVSKIPTAPPAMLGMMIYRNKTIPLIDLAAVLSVKNNINNTRRIIIITEFNKSVNGFLVDEVKQIHRLFWSDFVPIENIIGNAGVNVIGSVHMDNNEVMVVDMERILAGILPDMAIEEVTQEASNQPEKQKRENIRIVFAEDSKSVRDSVLRILKSAGYTNIQTFENGQKAHEALAAMSDRIKSRMLNSADLPDLIISDIEMPQMDGLTLCKKIKEDAALQHIPVIMFSSLINEQMIVKCKSVGAEGYITKPEMNKLVALLDKTCLQK
jgi:two-component system chemotaxis response regulator CheV